MTGEEAQHADRLSGRERAAESHSLDPSLFGRRAALFPISLPISAENDVL